jgi:hypothetical protein
VHVEGGTLAIGEVSRNEIGMKVTRAGKFSHGRCV